MQVIPLILFVTILILKVRNSVQQRCNEILSGKDYPGWDIPSYSPLSGLQTAEACRQKCEQTNDCYTWAFRSTDRACFLKYPMSSSPVDNSIITSGKCSPPSAPKRCTERLHNKNQIFGDIASYNPIRNLQLEECIDKCNNLPQCSKWTWNKNNHDCWLKTVEAYALNDDNSCVSGSCAKFFETLVGKDYVGYDIAPFNPIPNVQTLYDCIFTKCDKTPGCFAYSYRPNTKDCYLKGVTNGIANDDNGVITGQVLTPIVQIPNGIRCKTLMMGQDYWGGDAKIYYNVPQIFDCMAKCEQSLDAVKCTYIPATRECFIKTADTQPMSQKTGIYSSFCGQSTCRWTPCHSLLDDLKTCAWQLCESLAKTEYCCNDCTYIARHENNWGKCHSILDGSICPPDLKTCKWKSCDTFNKQEYCANDCAEKISRCYWSQCRGKLDFSSACPNGMGASEQTMAITDMHDCTILPGIVAPSIPVKDHCWADGLIGDEQESKENKCFGHGSKSDREKICPTDMFTCYHDYDRFCCTNSC
ncbi:unnamed protein product [Rotaria sordida]|uniref:Apple domain-containing protein n=1 Tax=Rotaria sordida TaxID=392033 RepID=A0A816AVZ9_9BILA|nr:unnamed protein product [Rotaria sordida]CAF1600816.1 unnamed protein product [Rotaria sordida]